MADRIERIAKHRDARAATLLEKLRGEGFSVRNVYRVDNFTLDAEPSREKLNRIGRMLINPVVERAAFMGLDLFDPFESITPKEFDWAVEVGLKPGVKDNVGETVTQEINDALKEQPPVYKSETFFIEGASEEEIRKIAEGFYNPQIEQVQIATRVDFFQSKYTYVPRVQLTGTPTADIVNIIGVDDPELLKIGKEGIANSDGTRRGTLSLTFQNPDGSQNLAYMKTIQKYFAERCRNPTDIELESIAQTWSEHCKHTIFADPIDDIKDGLYKTFIKKATEDIKEIWKKKGRKNFLVSVFKDNSGIIEFDENYNITHKVETHNSPSAIDPRGGSITGIVGVNRDAMGCGLFAKPIINTYGFCFGNPDDKRVLFRNKELSDKLLSPKRIMDGVIQGVNEGGNCSGIPTPQGFVYFDDRFRGKPLVFVGTAGLMPKTIGGKPSHEKKANPGDHIVMLGGRVGKDGIHGATFSSESLHAGSPAGAVQLGDPITQKKMSDALLEARDRLLYTSITDNGAGGLSCSVAEMANEAGGCIVNLEKVPTKYANMQPWEIWISESQERMTLSVPHDKWDEFSKLMKSRDVEATVIGEFTDSGRVKVSYADKTIQNMVLDLDLEFLHDGLPKIEQKSTYTKPSYLKPNLPGLEDLTESFTSLLSSQNIASYEFISKQFDHEVQGGSVLKPLQGRGRVNADTSITRPILSSKKGVVLSQGVNPSYSELDAYDMAACAIDTAIRNSISAGANPDHLAILDNFCWCSSRDPERLGQLKAAVQACYDYAVAYETPFISGKDSMFNDFKGFDENGNPVKISAPPTLLISSIGVIDDSKKAVSLDAKCAGDIVYVLGETHDEFGGSEYLSMIGQHGAGYVPKVDAAKNNELYRSLAQCIEAELIESAQSVHRGGLATALAKTAIGGKLGLSVSIDKLPGSWTSPESALYSESMGRIVVTVSPERQDYFEAMMGDNKCVPIGMITEKDDFVIKTKDSAIVNTKTRSMLKSYKSTFKDN